MPTTCWASSGWCARSGCRAAPSRCGCMGRAARSGSSRRPWGSASSARPSQSRSRSSSPGGRSRAAAPPRGGLRGGGREGGVGGKVEGGKTVQLDDGREVAPEGIVGEHRPGRRLVYSGDTRPCQATIEAARGADLLVHEPTFREEEKARAKETGPSTARGAADVARQAGARRLLLTHLSARYSRDFEVLLAEAREVFPETGVA